MNKDRHRTSTTFGTSSLTLIEATIDGGPPRHIHSREDESFYVLTEGRLYEAP